MRRPLALIGLTTMLVLTVCFYADVLWINWLFGLSLAGLAVTIAVKKLRQKPEFPAFFAVVMISVIGFTMFSEFYVNPICREFDGETAEVTAVLLDEPESYGDSLFYTVKTKTINGAEKSVKLSLGTNRGIPCEVGDTLKFTAELESTGYGNYLADSIYLKAYTYKYVEVSKASQKPFYYYIVELRQGIRGALYEELYKEPADLASAVLLGDRNFSPETYEALRHAGLTHMVVVSGLHLSIITMLCSKSFGRFIGNKYINAVVIALIVFFFLCLTGFGKSSIRAAIMLFVLMASKLFKREGDSLNSLGFAAILLCLNPFVVGDAGVLLSFSATFGIVLFRQPLYMFLTKRLKPVNESYYKRINKAVRFIADLFATTFTATVCTLPVNVIFFGKVSLVQIFANLIVVPFVQWFMLFSSLCVLFHFTHMVFIADCFAFIANVLGEAMLYVARFFASIPMAYVKADYDFVILWIVSVAIIFATAYFIRRNGKGLHLICVVMSAIVFASGAFAHTISSQNKVTVYVTPSKHGQSIVLCSKDGNVLINTSAETFDFDDTARVLEDIYSEKQLMVISCEDEVEYDTSLFDYKEVLMYDKISGNDCEVFLWDKAKLSIFERNGEVYFHLSCADTTVLILPNFGNAEDIPKEMRAADVLITSGIIDNMEILSFKTLISNGNEFRSSAVIDYFRNRDVNSVAVSQTINFDIVG